ncbi:putative leader peptide [Streptacidiphilus sp. ASG 303]|uniref:putative leader peptide n=1 Tax=Streptacidiphilus sp. ASG 303 TaxID=2896847 RepID=UPI0035AEBE92
MPRPPGGRPRPPDRGGARGRVDAPRRGCHPSPVSQSEDLAARLHVDLCRQAGALCPCAR